MDAVRKRLAAAALAALGAAWLAGAAPVAGVASPLDTKADLQKGLNDFDLAGNWIYDDIPAGFARAAREGKPVCVVFR